MPVTYYDRYDRETKGWKKLLFIEGLGLQVSELNEIQSVLGDELHELGRTLWSDGQVVRGVELIIKESTAELTPGLVYFAGYMHDFAGDEVNISKVGSEVIGLRFTEVIVTSAEDGDLFDPTSGWENSGYTGSHRLTYTLEATNNAADAVALYALQDGEWSADYRPASQASDMAQILARRTFDESGDYMVRGLRCSVSAKDSAQFWLLVSEGVAYVSGYEYRIPSRTRLVLDRPIQTDAVYDEPKTYSTGTDTYDLNNTPVAAITGVTATVEATVNITKGSAGGSDLMPLTPIVSIEAVWQGGTNYTVTTDYLVSGNYIDWSPGGIEPSPGSTYSVTLRYIKQMVSGVDFTKTGDAVDFSPGGDDPVNGTQVLVDYTYYLTRIDTLVMTRRGEFKVIVGQPSQFPKAPTVPASSLPIASIYMAANTDAAAAEVTQADRYRLTQQELARVRQRVSDLEYNAAVTDLEQEAINVELATSKKAIFTDPFSDTVKMDEGDVALSCSVGLGEDDLDTLFPGFVTEFFDLQQSGNFLVRAHTQTTLASQPSATHQVNVNPHQAYNLGGQLLLTPPNDIWLNDVVIEKTVTKTVRRWSGARSWGWWTQWTERTLLSEEQISGTTAAKTVQIDGSSYFPYSDNLKLVFDGVLTPLTPVGVTLPGSDPESVRADINGAFQASFSVAAGTQNGVHSVLIYNEDNQGSTQYRVDGRLRTWLEQTTIIRYAPPLEPVAQTLDMPADGFVRGVTLYFGAKPTDGVPVSVQLRNVVNGYPGPIVLAEATVLPASVAVTVDASTGTTVTFDEPAYCLGGEQYAVVVATNSQDYYLHYARLGFADQLTGYTVVANPYTGIMFTSANNSAWTAYQEQDLKFVLLGCDFSTTDRTILLLDAEAVDGSVITIMASETVPVGCNIVWEIKADADTSWTVVPANELVDLGRVIAELSVRVTLQGTATLSPILSSSIGLVVAKWDASGVYSSRDTSLSTYTSIRMYYDDALASDAAVQPYYSVDGGDNWVTMGAVQSSTVVADGWTERMYEVTGLSDPDTMKVKLALTTSTDRVHPPRVRRLRAIAT